MDDCSCSRCTKASGNCYEPLQRIFQDSGKAGLPLHLRCFGRHQPASIELHKSLGFVEVGHFDNAGFKLGSWRGIVWMTNQIGKMEEAPKNPLPLAKVL